MNKCIQCNKEYEAIRKTSIYCSPQCRKLAFQKASEVSVPVEKKVSVPGKCHGCGKDVSDLVCICLSCVQKGITHKSLGLKMCS